MKSIKRTIEERTFTLIEPLARLERQPKGYRCQRCSDAGYLMVEYVNQGTAVETKVEPCVCKRESGAQRNRTRLLDMDGLEPHEREIDLSDLVDNRIGKARSAIVEAVSHPAGFITLLGPPGRGKGDLLKGAVNLGRHNGISSCYRRLSDLMDELRTMYNEDGAFQKRWEIIVEAEILCVDEIDKCRLTDFAIERFDSLLDLRHRKMFTHLTILAANHSEEFSHHNRSRIQDRLAKTFTLQGVDMRKV